MQMDLSSDVARLGGAKDVTAQLMKRFGAAIGVLCLLAINVIPLLCLLAINIMLAR